MRNYDTVAGFYDRLSRMVFGSALVNAQRFLLGNIPPNATILIVGGGTGWILEEITKKHPSGLTITYVDASEKMVERSKHRDTGNNKVFFYASALETTQLNGSFDIVITPFLFDNLPEPLVGQVFAAIDRLLIQGAKWLYCDFQLSGPAWQRVLLQAMYLFFGTLSGVKAKHLPDMDSYFSRYGYECTLQKTFFSDFIVSNVFAKK